LNAFIRAVDRAHALLLTALIGILFCGVIVSVILRYFFGLSSVWAEEFLTMLFVASTFFGASLCLREKEHICMGLVDRLRSDALKKGLSVLVSILVIVVCSFIFHYGMVWISKIGAVPSPASGLPMAVYYSFVPLSFALTIFYAIVSILSEFFAIDESSTKSSFISKAMDEAPAEGGRS